MQNKKEKGKILKGARKKEMLPKKWTMNRLMAKFATTIETRKKVKLYLQNPEKK